MYNLLRVENYGVYIDKCQVAGHKNFKFLEIQKLNTLFVCYRKYNTLGGDIGGIYWGNIFDNRNYSPSYHLKKHKGTLQMSGKLLHDLFGGEKRIHETYKMVQR